MAIIEIQDVSFHYPLESTAVLKNINLEVQQGEFIVLMGQSGCGKSTLLRHLKRELTPNGTRSGTITYNDCPLEDLPAEVAVSEIGYVLQSPENQIVTDKVWHELAFGLESLGVDSQTIRRRVAEIANFFGIQKWFRQKTTALSGGQKQLLNLASVMVMQPKVLLLDEPTSQLDPIAAMEFIRTLQRLNEELGITIIVIEHRLEEVFPLVDRAIVMDAGEIVFDGKPKNIVGGLPVNHPMLAALPTATRLYHLFGWEGEAPLTIREGQQFLMQEQMEADEMLPVVERPMTPIVLEAKDIAFRYEKNTPDVIQHFNLAVRKGELFSIIGGNGTGKSTALSILSNLEKPNRGEVYLHGKKLKTYSNKDLYQRHLTLLPQDPKTLFIEKAAIQELESMASLHDLPQVRIDEMVQLFHLEMLKQRHPYDLSGGEQQKLALAKLLLAEPEILLLDEPTKGLDAHAKQELAEILFELKQRGMTIVMVTHDIEFSAIVSSRCALFFDGNLVSEDDPRTFYSGNTYYTTGAHRISRAFIPNAITCEDVIASCK